MGSRAFAGSRRPALPPIRSLPVGPPPRGPRRRRLLFFPGSSRPRSPERRALIPVERVPPAPRRGEMVRPTSRRASRGARLGTCAATYTSIPSRWANPARSRVRLRADGCWPSRACPLQLSRAPRSRRPRYGVGHAHAPRGVTTGLAVRATGGTDQWLRPRRGRAGPRARVGDHGARPVYARLAHTDARIKGIRDAFDDSLLTSPGQ
jgi:hypothetical protein